MERRSIPNNWGFSPDGLKPLVRTLLASNAALGKAASAYRTFTLLKSNLVSPDGSLGGHGYVQSILTLRKKLLAACELLSSVSDTISDELQAPHWQSMESAEVKAILDRIQQPVDRKASSMLPTGDNTPTEAHDWGLGFGAKGEAINYDYRDPGTEAPTTLDTLNTLVKNA